MRWIWVVVGMAATACAPTRVSMGQLPRVTNALEANAFYDTYRIEGVVSDELHVGRMAHSELTRIDSTVSAVVLANGVRVGDPRDLMPLVSENSETSAKALAWAKARDSWALPGAVAGVTLGAGFAGAIIGFATDAGLPLVLSSIGVMVLGPLVSLLAAKAGLPDVESLLVGSFRAYDADLRAMRDAYQPTPGATSPP